jgi:hypothetical protein
MPIHGLQQDESKYEQIVLPSHVPHEGKALFLPFRRLLIEFRVYRQPQEAPIGNPWSAIPAQTEEREPLGCIVIAVVYLTRKIK